MTIMGTGVIPAFTLADRLKKARQVTGLEQHEFAAKSGMSRATVANYEQGKTAPRPIYLRAWAEASGVDLEWLETGRGETTENERTPDLGGAGVLVRPEGFEPPAF